VLVGGGARRLHRRGAGGLTDGRMTGAVAITGVGQVSALGPDVAALAASVRAGRCGIGPLTLFAHRGRSSIAAQLASLPSLDVGLEPAVQRRLSRSDRMALAAADEACRM